MLPGIWVNVKQQATFFLKPTLSQSAEAAISPIADCYIYKKCKIYNCLSTSPVFYWVQINALAHVLFPKVCTCWCQHDCDCVNAYMILNCTLSFWYTKSFATFDICIALRVCTLVLFVGIGFYIILCMLLWTIHCTLKMSLTNVFRLQQTN